jgi:tetratricopeptide (TPR) repeat protein
VDNIVLKALHKDPKGRYPSVEQFSEDIRRHLTRMPVMARKVTAAYRIRKFVLRHKSGVFAAGAVVLALIAGMVGIIREARIADTQGARAERRFQDVRTLANSLLFELHDAIQNLPGATAAREVLVKRALQYLDSLSRESASDPTLRGELAEAYEKVGDVQGGYRASNLGDQAGAIASYRKALAIRESLATAAPGDFGLVRSIVRSTGKLSDLLLQTGNQAEALKHSLKLLPMAERLARHDPGNVEDQRNLASAYIDLGWKQAETGDWKAGLPNLRRAVLLFEGLAAAHPDDVVIQRRLAIAYERTGQIITANTESYGEALALHRKQVALAEQLSTAAPLNTDLRRIAAYAHVDLGENLMLTGDPAAAAPHYAKASAAFQSLSAADPRNVQYRVDAAMGLGVEANSAIETGHAARAIERLKQSLAILAEFPSAADSRELAVVNQFRMGKAYGRLGRWREACPWFERSLTGLVEAQQRGRLSGHDLDMIGEAREALRKCAGAALDH